MKIIAIEKDRQDIPEEAFIPYLMAEASRVWELYQAGIFRELYFRADQPEAILVLECASVPEAEKLLNTLPLVQNGLISFEVIPLMPYPGFARLFKNEEKNE